MTTPVEGAQGGTGTGGQSATVTTDGSQTAATATQGQGSQQQVADATVSRVEFDQLRNQLSAADQNRQKAQDELKKLQDAALSEEEKRKRDLEAATEQLRAKDETIKNLQLDKAFLTDNTHDWHNPQAALKLADRTGITVADDGKVTGLKEALEAVAKTHPYLLKPKAEDGATATGQAAAATGVTGVAGQGAATGQGNSGRSALEKKFPALRGRTS